MVSVSGAATASFVYDAGGNQVKTIVNGVTTYYVGNHYEVKNSVVTKYYFAGATRLAVRTNGTLSYLLGDHIGSSSVTTDSNGAKTASALYKAFGETRYTLGNLGTDYKFTGQREEASLGIYFFQSRWFDPSLGRFTQPDSIVPTSTQGTQAWDRYAFVNNNPVRYNDPTGHSTIGDEDQSHQQSHTDPCAQYGYASAQCRLYLGRPDRTQKDDVAANEPVYGHTIASNNPAANQQQTGRDDCGPTAIAIAACLYNPSSCGLTGDQVQLFMELANLKPFLVGVPTGGNLFAGDGYRMTLAINTYLPGADVTYANGTSLNDLRSNLANDSIVIVAVSWQTNVQILSDPIHATVGHYMVATGYDSTGFSFMDPGSGMTTPQTNSWTQQFWLDTSNAFISSGSMWIISTP